MTTSQSKHPPPIAISCGRTLQGLSATTKRANAGIHYHVSGLRGQSLLLLLALWIGAAGHAAAQSNQPDEPATKLVLNEVVTVNGQPEAATRDGDALLVSSLGPDDSEGANDGSVQRLFWDGSLDPSFHLATALDNPMGIVTIGNQILVVDVDRVAHQSLGGVSVRNING